jgi:thioesterase domain-containing protein
MNLKGRPGELVQALHPHGPGKNWNSHGGVMNRDEMISVITSTIPWVKMSGIRVDVFEDGHVKLVVPAANHMNHVGIIYAGTHFMLMEVAGAALFLTLYGVEKFIPINKGMSIRFLKPATTDITCELSMGRQEAQEKLKPVEERGKGEWVLDMTVTDAGGTTVSSSTCTYYLIPSPLA